MLTNKPSSTLQSPATGLTPMELGPAVQQTPQVDIRALTETLASLEEDPLESAFHGCINRVLIPEGRSQTNPYDTLKSIFSTSPQENLPIYLDHYVRYIATQKNHQRVTTLLQTLRSLVLQGHLKPRVVCEVLLRHLDLNRNILVWCETLNFVWETVGGVDYKGCRDLMKLLFDKFDRLPRSIAEEQVPALKQGQKLLAYILDRNSSLLPAYFAHDEICRHYPDKNSSPHWVLQEVVSPLQESMRETANLVSGLAPSYLRPVLGVSNMSTSVWRLDPVKHCCVLKGLLPYRECLLQPQEQLLYHVVAQQNSKDAIHSVLGVNRQQLQPSTLVEDGLVKLGLVVMELSERCREDDLEDQAFEAWSHFASQLVFCYFLQLTNITSLLTKLRTKLSHLKLRKGRDWLMWSLLHFSSTVQSKTAQPKQVFEKEFVPIMNLFSLLYQDREMPTQPLPAPDSSSPICIIKTAAASIWLVYANKAEEADSELPRPMPYILTKQIEWLNEKCEKPPSFSQVPTDYCVALLLNIYSNSNDVCAKLLNIMLDTMVTPSSTDTQTEGGASLQEATPIPIGALSLLAMHAKIRLMEMIKTHLIKVVESTKLVPSPMNSVSITPALLETYSRLLVWLGTRNFQSHLIPAVFKSQAWGVLHTLLEIIVFRVHLQLQYSYRFQLLQQLHTVASVSIIPTQLYGSTENAALRLIKGLNSPEFLIQLAKQFATDPKPLLSTDSEELNRIFVMVVAQSLHISNIDTTNWLEPFMRAVLTTAPNFWCERTLSYFPAVLRQFCSPPSLAEQKQTLLTKVEEESKRFRNLVSEMEQARLFTETESASFFLCVLWKQLMEGGPVNSVLMKIAQRIQPKKLAAFMRKFMDYIVFTFPHPTPPDHLSNVVSKLSELVWQYNLFPLDRLIMCMMLRGYEPPDSQQCLTLLCAILLQSNKLLERVNTLVSEVPADYWNRADWNVKHAAYLRKFPETFQVEVPGVVPASRPNSMHMYFGNICLRFLPVFDLLIQRILETPEVAKVYFEQLLDQYGLLYKFHDQPVSYLYSTLHYYERSFSTNQSWKKKLISSVISAQKDIHPMQWYFTADFTEYINTEVSSWTPTEQYYSKLVQRIVKGLHPFNPNVSVCDWHFSEFSSSLTFALYCGCVEIMALPLAGNVVAKQLIGSLYDKAGNCTQSEEKELLSWIDALGLVLVSLPECYHSVLYEEVQNAVKVYSSSEAMFPIQELQNLVGENHRLSSLLALMHSYWLHANLGLLLQLPQWMQTSLRPVVKNEWQLLYICHLIGPILNRLANEKPKLLLEVVMEIYFLVQSVDKHQEGLFKHCNVLCDFLYHIKYMHIGDRDEIAQIISTLQLPLKTRLRFLCPAQLLSDMTERQLPHHPPISTPALPAGSIAS